MSKVTGWYLHRQKGWGQPLLPVPELGTAAAAAAAVATGCACHWGVMVASDPPASDQVQHQLSASQFAVCFEVIVGLK